MQMTAATSCRACRCAANPEPRHQGDQLRFHLVRASPLGPGSTNGLFVLHFLTAAHRQECLRGAAAAAAAAVAAGEQKGSCRNSARGLASVPIGSVEFRGAGPARVGVRNQGRVAVPAARRDYSRVGGSLRCGDCIWHRGDVSCCGCVILFQPSATRPPSWWERS